MRKRNQWTYGLLALMVLFMAACSKSDSDDTGERKTAVLPPYETMAVDFGGFLTDPQSAKSPSLAARSGGNWLYPRTLVGIWNIALYTQLAVPVASFKEAFEHNAEYIGDQTWQWAYAVPGLASTYNARLTGQIVGEKVVWNMHVTKTGTEPFAEFVWFSGESQLDGSSGYWILNEGPDNQNPIIKIDWSRENDTIGTVRYTWERDTIDQGQPDPFKDSYLEYGLQGGDYNVFYNLHVYDMELQTYADVKIEWNKDSYYGRVSAPTYFGDDTWHCWNELGEDIACE